MIHDLNRTEELAHRAALAPPDGKPLAAQLRAWVRGGLRKPSFFGQKIVRFWAFTLITVVFVIHQYLVFQLAIEAGTQADIVRIYDSIFYEWGSAQYGGGYQIASLIAGIYSAVALNAVSYCSISCAGNIIQVRALRCFPSLAPSSSLHNISSSLPPSLRPPWPLLSSPAPLRSLALSQPAR